MALNIKKGDNVLVIAGKDKGKNGKVLTAIPADNAVVVSGVNILAKHKKPRSAQDKGGIIKKESKIDASNVQIICPACNKATRVSMDVTGDKKFRKCKKCGASLDKAVAKKETKKETKTTKKAEPTKAAPAKKAPAKKPVAKKSTELTGITKGTTTKKAPAKKTQAKGQ